MSLPIGSVRCTERHLLSDPPTPAELRAQRRAAEALVRPALSGWPSVPVIGVAGTITTLAAIRLGAYDPARVHRLRLSRDEVESITARLAALPLAERRRVPGLHPERAPVIVAGGRDRRLRPGGRRAPRACWSASATCSTAPRSMPIGSWARSRRRIAG